MDLLLVSVSMAVAGIFALLFVIFFSRSSSKGGKNSKTLPPEAHNRLPIIGHLHHLKGAQLPHIALGAMADKFGPIFRVRFGMNRAVIVTDSEIVKECLYTNDKCFSNRPKMISLERMGYNGAMFVFAEYGTYWREIRKIATLELLTSHRLDLLKHGRESEVKACMKGLYEGCVKGKSRSTGGFPVELKRLFGRITLNVVTRAVVGKPVSISETGDHDSDRILKVLRDFVDLTAEFIPGDSFPFLRWLDLGGRERIMVAAGKKLDEVLAGWLDEHKTNKATEPGKNDQDFMDVMLSVLNERGKGVAGYDSDTINKATCLTLILAGTDTTTVTLTWAVSLLLNNPQTLKKAQEELDTVVGRDRQVTQADIKNLVYIQAILKETLRLYPPAPLLNREATEDSTVRGYNIPAGTHLLLNLYKIHRDPKAWPEPLEFRPERFLTTHKHIDIRGQHFELIPFGSGRRVCPGITFAIQVFQYTLATFLHGFDIKTPSNEPVDMSESFALTNLKTSPLDVLVTPRLPAHLY